MKAMIFAAGIGKRLGEITSRAPKALVEINGRSMLRMAVEYVASQGFDDIIINVHHFADMVETEIKNLVHEGFRITVSDERELLLETGGGLYKARSFFDNEPFLLYNADIITDLDLGAFYRFHATSKGIATLAVADRNHNRVFLVNTKGIVCGWLNRYTGERIMSRDSDVTVREVAFSGIHIVDPSIFSFMKEGVYSLTALYLELARTTDIYTFRHDKDFWADIGTPDDLSAVRLRFEGK
jgi:N-acetyl-alpha-D-muramate 1-phosphate uridylyltransferase